MDNILRPIVRFAASGVLFIFVLNATAEDWLTYRHDLRRSGVTAEQLPVTELKPHWIYKSPVPPRTAWSAPARWDAYAKIIGLQCMRDYDYAFHVVCVGQSVYFGSSVDDAVHCLDAHTGKEKWVFFTEGAVRVAPSFANDKLYFGSDDGYAYCITADVGKLVWNFRPLAAKRILHNGRFISPYPCRTGVTVADDIAYCGFSLLPWNESYICALDAVTGKVLTERHFARKVRNHTLEAAPVVHGDVVAFPQGRVPPILFSKKNGVRLIALKGGGGSFITATKDNQIIHAPGNKTGWVSVTNLKTGKQKSWGGKTKAIVIGDLVYWTTDQHVIVQDWQTKKTRWQQPFPLTHDIIAAGDAVFAGGKDEVRAYGRDDGKLLWQSPVFGSVYGLAVANGTLFVSTDEGYIYGFREGKGIELPIAKTIPAVITSPKKQFVPPVKDDTLINRWIFHGGMSAWAKRRGLPSAERRVQDLAGSLHATILGDVRLQPVGGVQALQLDGETNSVRIMPKFDPTKLPAREMTAEAWVCVQKPLRWGGIIGAIQDNGDYERGWILGYSDSSFCFGLATTRGPGKMTYLKAKTPFETGLWYHVIGTFDGIRQRLFVNGVLSAESTAQKGDISYPEKTFYDIGAYHDDNEQFRMTGLIHEVRVYRRALNEDEAAKHYAAKKVLFPRPINLALGPYAVFTRSDSAVVRWITAKPSPTVLEWSLGGDVRRYQSAKMTRTHEVKMDGLRRKSLYRYVIHTLEAGIAATTPAFELDTHLNFTMPPLAAKRPSVNAKNIFDKSSIRNGMGLVYQNAELAYDLALQSRLRIVVVDSDLRRVTQARQSLYEKGVYGRRVAVHHVESLDKLPFVDKWANLIVDERNEPRPLGSGRSTMLRPNGGVLLATNGNGGWMKSIRGPVEGAGQWSHLYGNADNSAFGGEALGGAKSAGDLHVQWLGLPGPRAQPDRNGRKPSPLSVNGRLFVQGMRRIISVDAFNGTILWSLEIPPMQRFNVPRDCGNWCADDDHVYAAVGNRCWQIDAQSGNIVAFHPVIPGKRADWKYDWGYIARHGGLLLGSAVKSGSIYTNFWGNANAGWYDARSGPVTFKVCSDNLFAKNLRDGKHAWIYENGVILNSTITTAADRVMFVECRHPKVVRSVVRRIGAGEIWQQQYLVALDAASGKKVWEQPLDTVDGMVMFSMAYGHGKLVLVSSTGGKYHVVGVNAANGKTVWKQQFGWPRGKGDHGKAMSRPAIVGGKVYIRPNVLDISTGKVFPEQMPLGGCGTYAATERMFIFRSGNLTLWDAVEKRTSSWSRLRPGCWLSTIPANGMLLSPEGGGGCSCGNWMETSFGFMPRR